MKVEEVLQKYEYKPDMLLDQHFLADEKIVGKLLSLIDINETDVIFEVGAGIGTFTEQIPKCKKIFAVDIDKKVIQILKKEVKRKEMEIIEGNALELLSKLKFTKIMSSTPYSICEPLFHKLFIIDFEKALVIVPEKFSSIITEGKSPLGFFSNLFLEINSIVLIPREKFLPKPKVDSVALLITKKKPSISQQIYLQKDKKIKNLLRELLCKNKKLTKKQAKDAINKQFDGSAILEKKPGKLKIEELEELEKFITSC
ncbi:MAG: rRNA adenine N-6-methyltransferase family protein [Nanoarchaeota archaeon]